MFGRANASLIVVSLWLFGFAATVRAQNASAQNFAPQTIVLPLEVVAGQPATIAVLGANGRVAASIKVGLSNGATVTTDESGRAHFLAPPETGVMLARIQGTDVREAAEVLPQASSEGNLQAKIPRMVSLENYFAISGAGFQGDADRNRVEVDEKSILVLGASPVQLIVMPPANAPPGPANLVVNEGTAEIATKTILVDIVSSDSSDIRIPHGKSAIVLRARGTDEPLDLDVRNLTPQTAQFPQGNDQIVHTAGGAENTATVELKGVRGGRFSCAVRLENASAIANLPAASDFLETARKMAQPGVANRLEAIVKELHRENADIAKVRSDVQQISEQGGSGDFQALIRAARRALMGE
jgi:hypothetical protein